MAAAAPPLEASDAAPGTPTTDTTSTPVDTGMYEEDAAANEWTSQLESLIPPKAGTYSYAWGWAVAAPLVVLSRIVAPYFDAAATRVLPTYGAVVEALRELGHGDAVPKFQAAWALLHSHSDGRAVIAICRVAATGGVLLGRRFHERTLQYEPNVAGKLAWLHKGKPYLPACIAALNCYRAQPAPPTTECLEPELPSMASLNFCADDGLPDAWYLAVAPALMAMELIVARYIPQVAGASLLPMRDSMVMTLQRLGLDEEVPAFKAAWQDLLDDEDGRAVIAVCQIATNGGYWIGADFAARLVADPGLEKEVAALFEYEDCLPALLGTFRRYRAEVAKDAAAADAGAGGAAAAGGAGSSTCEFRLLC